MKGIRKRELEKGTDDDEGIFFILGSCDNFHTHALSAHSCCMYQVTNNPELDGCINAVLLV
jgi:hypothetical protein